MKINKDESGLQKLEEISNGMEEVHDSICNLFKYSRDLICILRVDGSFIVLSDNWESLLGFSIEEIMHMGWTELIHPDDLSVCAKSFATRVRVGVDMDNLISRWRKKDGTYVKLCWNTTRPIDGKIYSIARTCPLLGA